MDWSAWAGTYEIWLRRREQYQAAIQALKAQTPIKVFVCRNGLLEGTREQGDAGRPTICRGAHITTDKAD